jgi:YVTN family beta-propeller protein
VFDSREVVPAPATQARAILVFLALACLFFSSAHALWYEATVPVPDNFSGVQPWHLAYNQTDQKVYTAGTSSGVVVIDAVTHQKVARFNTTGFDVLDLAWSRSFDRVYAADYYGNDVTVADGVTNQVLATIPVVHPYRLAVDEALGKLYVASDSYVAVVDLASNAVRKLIPMPASPTALLLDSLRHRVYALGWLTNTLWIIDADADSTVKVMNLPGVEYAGLLAMNPRDNKLYCGSLGSVSNLDTVDVVSLPGDSVLATIPLPPDPHDMLWNPDNDLVYVCCQSSTGIIVISGTGDSIVAALSGNKVSGPHRLALDSALNLVYAIGVQNGFITVIDGNTQQVDTMVGPRGNFTAGLKPPDHEELYVADDEWCDVTVFDCATMNRVAQMEVGTRVGAVAWDSTDNCLYTANVTSASISVIAGTTPAVTDTIHVGGWPNVLLWVPQNDKLYCACQTDSTIWIIDCRTNQVLDTVRGLSEPVSMAYSPTSDKLYCAYFYNAGPPDTNFVTVIGGTSNRAIATIKTGDNGLPFLLWCRSGDRMYWSLRSSVSVIDCAHDSVEKTIPQVGSGTMVLDTIDNLIYHICDAGGGSALAVIDATADTAWTKKLPMGEQPTQVVWNSRKNVVYAMDLMGISVQEVHCPTESLIGSLNFVGYPAVTYWNWLNDKVYTVLEDMDEVLTFDAQTLEVLDTIPLPGGMPDAAAWDKVTNRTYVGLWNGCCVSVLRDNLPGVAEGPGASLHAGHPALEVVETPARRQVEFSASSCVGANPTVRIYDPAGRRVRTLFSVGLKDGQCRFLWNGTDASGKMQPSGTYFARLTTGNGSAVRKVVFFSE